MLREGTVFANRIIEFYTGKGVECSVVDEHSSLLVMLCSEGVTREFRCGRRVFSGEHNWQKIYRELEREFSILRKGKEGRGGYDKYF